ncbi:Serologically defined colon cancer antigen 8 [Varanus komodoensis]|nr:Serologically defined colon cancer antigen 8 [Varanus komodoensis]
MTCPSWVDLHGIAHSFIELRKPLCHDNAALVQCEQLKNEMERQRERLEKEFAIQLEKRVGEHDAVCEEMKKEKENLSSLVMTLSQNVASLEAQVDRITREKISLANQLEEAQNQNASHDMEINKQAAFHKCVECGSKMSPADLHNLCLLCLGEGHRTDKCGYCLAFTKQVRKNRENRLHKLLWDQALMQSDQLVLRPGSSSAAPSQRSASAAGAPLKRPALASTAPPQRPLDEGATSMEAQQLPSSPAKKQEKCKHTGSDKPSAHKKPRKEKADKTACKGKNPDRPKHRGSSTDRPPPWYQLPWDRSCNLRCR